MMYENPTLTFAAGDEWQLLTAFKASQGEANYS